MAEREGGVADREQGGSHACVIGAVRVWQELAAVGDGEDVVAAGGQARQRVGDGFGIAGIASQAPLMGYPAQQDGRVVECR